MEQPKINRVDTQIALEAAFKAAEGLDRRTKDRVSNVVEQLLDEKTEAFNNEVRKLWADTFTAYTRSDNSREKASAKNWADEAVEEYKKRFTPKLF